MSGKGFTTKEDGDEPSIVEKLFLLAWVIIATFGLVLVLYGFFYFWE